MKFQLKMQIHNWFSNTDQFKFNINTNEIHPMANAFMGAQT